jgi:hypothetical protein
LPADGNITFSSTVFQGGNWSNSWKTIIRSGPGANTLSFGNISRRAAQENLPLLAGSIFRTRMVRAK